MKLKKLICLALFTVAIVSCSKDDGPTAPKNNAPVISAQTFSAQDDISDTVVIGTVKATDPDDDTITFCIKTNDNNLFEISSNGALSLASGKSLDFATSTSHSIVVCATDGTDGTEATITINVTNSNTAPVAEAQTFEAEENIAPEKAIGAVVATDADEDALSFSISVNDNDLFEITSAGELSLAEGKNLDFEDSQQHSITVAVSDGTDQIEVEVTVEVVNVIDTLAEDPASFITTWNAGAGNQIRIYTLPSDFTVDWGDGTVETITTINPGIIAHTYETDGIYTVAVQGTFPGMSMDEIEGATPELLASIEQWGNIQWEILESAFIGCSNMVYNATDTPNLSNVTNMDFMFADASSFNGAIGNWNIGSITTMSGMLDNSGMSAENLSATIIGWHNFVEQNNGPSNITLGINGVTSCGEDVFSAAFGLFDTYGWQFAGGPISQLCF